MKIEIRSNSIVLDGYVNAVERNSRVLLTPLKEKFVETIKSGAFKRALENADDVKLLFNHLTKRCLGSIKQGNLELFEDSIGLRAICTIYDDEIIEKAKNGELRGWSFGFVSLKDSWQKGDGDIQYRSVEELEIAEVSILDKTPAYIATTIETRNDQDVFIEHRNRDTESRCNQRIDYAKYETIIKKFGGNINE